MSFHIRKLIAGHKGSWQAEKAPKRSLATKRPKSDIPYQEVNSGTTGSWQAKKAPTRDLATTQPKGGIPYQEVNSGTQGLLAGLEFVVRTFSEFRVYRGRSGPFLGSLGEKEVLLCEEQHKTKAWGLRLSVVGLSFKYS